MSRFISNGSFFILCSLGLSALASFQPPNPNVGAVYFITNHPNGNSVVSHSIALNGTLTYGGAYRTGGKGSAIVFDPPSPDALETQDSVQVSGNRLFAVNAGSNSISVFDIDPVHPSRLSLVGKPIDSRGDFPVTLAVSPINGNVCVGNGGAIRNVQCFRQDRFRGLVPLLNTHTPVFFGINVTTPPANIQNTFSHLLFSEDGKQLLLSVKGFVSGGKLFGGTVAVWNVGRDGTLSHLTEAKPKDGVVTFSMTQIAGRNAYLNSDPQLGYLVINFETGLGDKATSQSYTVEDEGAICWTQYSKKTGTYFMTDLDNGIIYEVAIDRHLNATIISRHQQKAGSLDERVVSIRGKDFLYSLSPDDLSIMVLSLRAPTNTPNIQEAIFKTQVQRQGVPLDGLYVQGMHVYIKPEFD